MAEVDKEKIKLELEKTDTEIIRLLEDLIEILIAKEILNYTDLPHAAMQKLLQRKKLRSMLSDINPFESSKENSADNSK